MDERSPIDFEGPVGPDHGAGLDATANTSRVLNEEIRTELEAMASGGASDSEAVADPKFSALVRSLRARPEIAKHLANKTRPHREGKEPPETVDGLVTALVEIGLGEAAPELLDVLEEEYDAAEGP